MSVTCVLCGRESGELVQGCEYDWVTEREYGSGRFDRVAPLVHRWGDVAEDTAVVIQLCPNCVVRTARWLKGQGASLVAMDMEHGLPVEYGKDAE